MKRTLEKKSLLVIFGCLLIVMSFTWWGQFYRGWQPCPLCLYQQYIYVGAMLLSGVGLFAPNHALARTILICLTVLLAANGALALYQVAVEHHWVPLPASCRTGLSAATTVEELRQQILGTPAPQCDVPMVHIFGLSLAVYSVLLSTLLSGTALYCAFLRRGRKA